MQNEDMMIGKSWPALTNLHRILVCSPKGQWPSKVDHRVRGEVKLHRKKSDKESARMNEFLGSVLNFLVVTIVISRIAFRVVPKTITGR